MFQTITSLCMPSCLRGSDVQEEPTDSSAGRHEARRAGTHEAGRAGHVASVGPSQASASMLSVFDLTQEIQRDLQQVHAWPRSRQTLDLLDMGRHLICAVSRAGQLDTRLRQWRDDWQCRLGPFKECWSQSQTLKTQALDLSPPLCRLPPERQDYVDEQLLYARQDQSLARQAFGERRFNTALIADARAAEHLFRARQLVTVFSRQPEACHLEVIRLLDEGREQNHFREADTRLGQLCPDVPLPPMVASPPDSPSTIAPPGGDVRPMAVSDFTKRLRTVSIKAVYLPMNQRLQSSFMEQCSVLERAFKQRPRGAAVPEAMRQQLHQLEALLEADAFVRAQIEKVRKQLGRVKDAAEQRQALQPRLMDAHVRFGKLQSAHEAEDYGTAVQIFEEAVHVNKTTLALLHSGIDEANLRCILEHRDALVAQAAPWIKREPVTYTDRLRHNHFKQVLAMFDRASELEVLQTGIYELEEAVNHLHPSSPAPSYSQSPPAWGQGQRLFE